MLAARFEKDALILKEEEARSLAVAMANVANQFEILGHDADPRLSSLLTLAWVAGLIYGPRAVDIYADSRNKPKG
jgi:hypothetical protein